MKRTSILLDRAKVDAARELLGTTTVTDTVHAALDEIVAARLRVSLFDQDIDWRVVEASREQDRAEDLSG